MLFKSALISANELAKVLDHANLVILDCTIDKVGQTLKDKQVELIPNSLFFDIEGKLSAKSSTLPHTLVSATVFENEMKQLGINSDSTIVLYDRWGIYSSPRAWWMFKTMGFDDVYILNGGLPNWKKSNFRLTKSYISPTALGNFKSNFRKEWFADKDYILDNYKKNIFTIYDARSEGRFKGVAPEPREGLNAGHIPHSKNIPFEKVLNGEEYKNVKEIIGFFENDDTTMQENIFSCGSGITASIIAFASYLVGIEKIRVYDGSWSEWGSKELDLPIEK